MATSDEQQIKTSIEMAGQEEEQKKEELLTVDLAEVDRTKLWGILKKTQCPLLPGFYEGEDTDLVTMYYFNNEFWAATDETGEEVAADEGSTCRKVMFPDTEDGKDVKRQAMDDAEMMLGTDEYIKNVRVNKSYEIYEKLLVALQEAKGEDDGDDSNDAYKKLVPTPIGRIMFLMVFFTTALNGYFLTLSLTRSLTANQYRKECSSNFDCAACFLQTDGEWDGIEDVSGCGVDADEGYDCSAFALAQYVSYTTEYDGEAINCGLYDVGSFMSNMAIIMAICEMILYCNLLIGSVMSYGASLIYCLITGKPVYYQCKVIAQELRSMSTLSILRYLPSVEIVSGWLLHWTESVAKILADIFILFGEMIPCLDGNNAKRRKNICQIIFAVPCYVIEVFAPLLALYAILVKMVQLRVVVQTDISDWADAAGIDYYILFFGFLNQVAGLRVLRNVETSSIQHFVFSGPDASLDADELLFLEDWWSVTVLSAQSNLNLWWYDNMVFWYSLDPQKIQLLLKSHETDMDGTGLRDMMEQNDDILINYDQMVMRMLQE